MLALLSCAVTTAKTIGHQLGKSAAPEPRTYTCAAPACASAARDTACDVFTQARGTAAEIGMTGEGGPAVGIGVAGKAPRVLAAATAGMKGAASGARAKGDALRQLVAAHSIRLVRTTRPTSEPRPAYESLYVRVVKRFFDIVISLLMMPFLLLFVLCFGIAIRLEDGGPIFYNAPRMGKNWRPFTMYKFRSMKVNAPDLVMEDGSTYNGADDPRMTRIGAFMRRMSIDEFPQFLNVLKGDMSVIGPRPDLERECELYEGDEGEKLLVRPGITGWAAVSGRNAIQWHDRLKLDVEYVRDVSFHFDLKVFFLTFKTIFSQEGIYISED